MPAFRSSEGSVVGTLVIALRYTAIFCSSMQVPSDMDSIALCCSAPPTAVCGSRLRGMLSRCSFVLLLRVALWVGRAAAESEEG